MFFFLRALERVPVTQATGRSSMRWFGHHRPATQDSPPRPDPESHPGDSDPDEDIRSPIPPAQRRPRRPVQPRTPRATRPTAVTRVAPPASTQQCAATFTSYLPPRLVSAAARAVGTTAPVMPCAVASRPLVGLSNSTPRGAEPGALRLPNWPPVPQITADRMGPRYAAARTDVSRLSRRSRVASSHPISPVTTAVQNCEPPTAPTVTPLCRGSLATAVGANGSVLQEEPPHQVERGSVARVVSPLTTRITSTGNSAAPVVGSCALSNRQLQSPGRSSMLEGDWDVTRT